MRFTRLINTAWLCILLAALTPLAYAEDTVIAVIVSANSEYQNYNQVAGNELNLIFWRKKLYWPKGHRIYPANLHAEHPLRLAFSQHVLHSLPMAQTNYWNGLYFHGVRPPHSLQSEEAMLRYVADTKGAIGYVDACNVDERVRTILWISQNQISSQAPENLHCK